MRDQEVGEKGASRLEMERATTGGTSTTTAGTGTTGTTHRTGRRERSAVARATRKLAMAEYFTRHPQFPPLDVQLGGEVHKGEESQEQRGGGSRKSDDSRARSAHFTSNLREVAGALDVFIGLLSEKLCERQPFDPTHLFSACVVVTSPFECDSRSK